MSSSEPLLTDLLSRAIGWLGPKPRTIFEMRRYLAARFPEATSERVEDTIKELRRRRYLDDDAYADAFVDEARRRHPMGKNLIRVRLRERGIEEGAIERSLDALSRTDEIALAKQVAQKHQRLYRLRGSKGGLRLEGNRRNQARLMRALDQRGFPEDIARAVVFDMGSEGDAGEQLMDAS